MRSKPRGSAASCVANEKSRSSPSSTAAWDCDAPAPDAIAHDSRVTLTELRVATLPDQAKDPARLAPEQYLNAELSWLEFNARVLELAEDSRTPLAARLRFLSIFSTNLDQFVM